MTLRPLFLAFALGWSPTLPSGHAAEKPSIVVILADDLGYEALGCYGGKDFKTPHLDQLAAEGVRLTRACTSPVCTPSRMSLYTGQYTVNHGYRSVLPVHVGSRQAVNFEKIATLPQSLRKAGYTTSVTGKWQLAALEFHPKHIESAGFDSWCVWQIWKDGAKTTRYWDPCFNHDGKIRDDIADRYGPDVLADYVIAQMKSASEAGRPFYIHHNMLLPHWPILQTAADKVEGNPASLAGMIEYMDRIVGRLVTAVDDLGIADKTWVIFLGDNGTDSRKPRNTTAGLVHGGKNKLSDAGAHIPVIIRGPGLEAPGATFDHLVDMADFFPTICELAGASVPESAPIDGISFASRLLGIEAEPARKFVTAGLKKDDFVFDGSWRLHRQGGVLVDCRKLPEEIVVEKDDAESAAARLRLGEWLEQIKRN